jgi:methylmalonyl-CoA mutase
MGGMTEAIGAGLPTLKIEECAARQQARIDGGRQVIVGVNKYVGDGAGGGGAPPIEVRHIDNSAVLAAQKARLAAVRAGRDPARVAAALEALEAAARGAPDPGGADNLLARSVEAARARASVGEITAALEAVWGRHQAGGGVAAGSYAHEMGPGAAAELAAVAAAVARFEAAAGRRPRVLVAKMGMDGHDRGAKVMATG